MRDRIDLKRYPQYRDLAAVLAFFDAINDSNFVRVVENLTRGIGAHTEKVHCTFPGDMDEYELVVERNGKVPDGIEFSFDWGEEVVVDVPTFRRLLTLACESYVRDHPEDGAKIEELLARPQPALTPPGTNIVY